MCLAPQIEKNFSTLSNISKRKKRVGIFIQARTNSKRLPNKVLKMVNRKSILERCLISLRPLLDHPNIDKKDIFILCTTSDQKKFDKIATKYSVNFNTCFNTNENKVLERFYDAANFSDVDYIVRICADKIINHTSTQLSMIDFMLENEELDYLGCDKEPLRSTTGEVYKAEALKSLYREIVPGYISYTDNDGYLVEDYVSTGYNNQEILEHISVGFKNVFDIEPHIKCDYDWSIDTKEELIKIQEMVASYYINNRPQNNFLELEEMIKIKEKLKL